MHYMSNMISNRVSLNNEVFLLANGRWDRFDISIQHIWYATEIYIIDVVKYAKERN